MHFSLKPECLEIVYSNYLISPPKPGQAGTKKARQFEAKRLKCNASLMGGPACHSGRIYFDFKSGLDSKFGT